MLERVVAGDVRDLTLQRGVNEAILDGGVVLVDAREELVPGKEMVGCGAVGGELGFGRSRLVLRGGGGAGRNGRVCERSARGGRKKGQAEIPFRKSSLLRMVWYVVLLRSTIIDSRLILMTFACHLIDHAKRRRWF